MSEGNGYKVGDVHPKVKTGWEVVKPQAAMSDRKPLVSVVLPVLITDAFLLALTEMCIKAMRCQANDQFFELVLVETGTKFFDPRNGGPKDPYLHVDTWVHRDDRTTYTQDWNAGADAASGDYLVHMGNDVIVSPAWDRALCEPFERYKDCGVSCCASTEPGAHIGPRQPVPGLIVEGMFAPMMMFANNWRLDEAYPGGYSDADLIMRMYAAGLRAYRNCGVQVHHLDRVTFARADKDRGEGQIAVGEQLFYERWNGSPHMMYAMIRAGAVVYGREHESYLSPLPSAQRRQAPR